MSYIDRGAAAIGAATDAGGAISAAGTAGGAGGGGSCPKAGSAGRRRLDNPTIES
jgi:hypothetical protein